MELSEHLFRREAGRLVTALTRIFGVHNLALAEDVVQDAFCRALEVWKFQGIPQNPSAWLMATAKNRALDVLRRERTARTYAPELTRLLESEWTLAPVVDELLSPHAIKDDQLRMMFSSCAPRLSEESQIALILHILCGFTVAEIAGALVRGHAAVEKRVTRAKAVLAQAKHLFDIGDASDFSRRLPAVQRALYLLFNEGYHGASTESAVRAELCEEAMRLGALLVEHPLSATPASSALLALMSLHAARLPGRLDSAGNLSPLLEQDRSRWNQGLIARGERLLERSATGPEISEYHVEAAIAALHSTARRAEDTNWGEIAALYATLMRIRPSPVVALHQAIAVAEHQGPAQGLAVLDAIPDRERLVRYPFYFAARGELELRSGRPDIATTHFREALALARNPTERRFLTRRIEACASPDSVSRPRRPARRARSATRR